MRNLGVEVVPSAKRMVRSLRDMGYDFTTAVADLIDNSIEAKCNTVRVSVEWDGASSYVMIADNGEGMTPEKLKEALRFGSERDYEDDADLGKFGLGLKTASLSQCLKVTVATRYNPNRADINAYCWDVQHIEATNRWEILPIKTAALPLQVRQHLKETPGTVIVWERLDRILDYKNPDGEHARKQLLAMTRELEDHVGMVFHRFLSGEIRGKRLAIYVNENKVEPWDPFARREEHTKKLDARPFRLEGANGRADIVVEPFVLPSQALFSSPEAFTRASGPRKWNTQQGFYIYRADRMIQSGGWCGLRALDEHRKLSRIAISFTRKLDDEFKINVAKMRVQLPAEIREDIEKWIRPAVKMAEDIYRGGRKALPVGASVGLPPSPSPKRPDEKPAGKIDLSSTTSEPHKKHSSLTIKPKATKAELDIVAGLLIEVAKPSEVNAIESAVARAREMLGA